MRNSRRIVFFVFFAVALGFFSRGLSVADNIRVLIIDEEFSHIPEGGESLVLLDRAQGRLLVKEKPYSGNIEVWTGANGIYLINEIPLEEYVKSVVKAETGRDWAEEALKAQAVISRTYALAKKLQNGSGRYHLTSTVLHQVYKGDIQDEKVEDAVNQTRGEILVYNGKPIEALYHSTCGGQTEDPEDVFSTSLPYLKAQKAKCELSPYSIWARRFSAAEVAGALGLEGIESISIKTYTKTGRAKELEIVSEKGPLTMRATDFRRLLGWKKLPSTAFSLEMSDGYLNFEGKGYGHGVGLCQWSALEMAREGKDYREILSFYYPGAKLIKKNAGQ